MALGYSARASNSPRPVMRLLNNLKFTPSCVSSPRTVKLLAMPPVPYRKNPLEKPIATPFV